MRPLDDVGVRVAGLAPAQPRLAVEILDTNLGVLPAVPRRRGRQRLERAGIDELCFGWAGALEPNEPHYYRLQGPTFVLEFDNSRKDGTHIHSVWRDFREDFGFHLAWARSAVSSPSASLTTKRAPRSSARKKTALCGAV